MNNLPPGGVSWNPEKEIGAIHITNVNTGETIAFIYSDFVNPPSTGETISLSESHASQEELDILSKEGLGEYEVKSRGCSYDNIKYEESEREVLGVIWELAVEPVSQKSTPSE